MTKPMDFDNTARLLAAAMREEADLAMTTTNTPQELQRFRDDVAKRRRRNQVLAAAAATILVGGGATYAGFALSDHHGKARLPGSHTPAPTVTQTLPAPAPLPAGTHVSVLDGPVQLGPSAFGAVWATGPGSGSGGNLYRISLDGTRIVSSTPYAGFVIDRPPIRIGNDIAVPSENGAASAWLLMSPTGHPLASIPVTVTGLGAGDASGGWLQTDSGTVARLDAGATHFGRQVAIAGAQMSAFALGGGYFWVGDENSIALLQVDPNTGSTVHSYSIATGSSRLNGIVLQAIYSNGAVFVSSSVDFALRRIDVTTHSVTAITHSPTDGYWFLLAIAPDGSLWGESANGVVDHFNPATLAAQRVSRVFTPSGKTPRFGNRNQLDALGFGVTVTADHVFVTDGPAHKLYSYPLS